jgi:hypothetical protein
MTARSKSATGSGEETNMRKRILVTGSPVLGATTMVCQRAVNDDEE